MKQVLKASVALMICFALFAGGLVHDLIPHDHSHSTQNDMVWKQLHSVVRHTEKKVMLSAATDTVFAVSISRAFMHGVIQMIENRRETAKEQEYLRRGIAPYRHFS